MMTRVLRGEISVALSSMMRRRTRCVTLQKRKRMQNAERMADMMLTISAICVLSAAKWLKKLPVSMKKGAPGGCPTSRRAAVVVNSGQSQKGAEGSTVRM